MSRTRRKSKDRNRAENVLVTLGFEDAEGPTAKASLARKLNELIDKRGLSQKEGAAITGMRPIKVSQVRLYKLKTVSLDQLMHALVSLDQHVQIVVKAARHPRTPTITVVA